MLDNLSNFADSPKLRKIGKCRGLTIAEGGKMRRRLAICIAVTVAVTVVFIGCKKNRAPEVPQVSGPNIGRPGDTLTYTVTTNDPEEQEVAYKFAWGDTSTIEWSSYYASGQQVVRTHVYPDSGVHNIRVKARDTEEAESDWSDSITVAIGFRPPNTPSKPDGPTNCTTGVSHTFTTSSTHPFSDSVWLQFDWGGTVGDWGGPVASGSLYQEVHIFDSAGTYEIMARAKDSRSATSTWSDPLTVTVVTALGGPPTDLCVGGVDTLVILAWTAPAQGNPNNYNIYFREVGSSSFALETSPGGEITVAVLDPGGVTGLYIISAAYGSAERFCTDTVSTIPVHTSSVTMTELNAGLSSGYGWNRATGVASTYLMSQAGNAAYVDLYITDWAVGHTRPPYSIASPDMGPSDPGGVVPPAAWRANGFTDPLTNEQAPLPSCSTTIYFNYTDISQTPMILGCHTEDSYYAMIKVLGINIGNGEVQLESWFQLIQGLRLIKH